MDCNCSLFYATSPKHFGPAYILRAWRHTRVMRASYAGHGIDNLEKRW